MTSSNRVLKIQEELVEHERINGEVIVISFKSGKYFSLGGTAADIWTLCTKPISETQITRKLREIWSSAPELENQVASFIDQCIENEIISNIPLVEEDSLELPNDLIRSEWNQPSLMIFGNLQDLIMVDPVHDASLIEWPIQKDFEFGK